MADNSGDDEWLNTKVVQQRGSRRLIRNGSGGSQFDIRSALSGETSWGRFSGLSVMGFKGGTVTMARAKNQDSVFAGNVGKSSSLFAIFDGHGKYGHDVSQFLAEKISGSLAATVKAAEAAGDGLQVSTVQTLLETSLQALHDEVSAQKFDSLLSGSTGILVLVCGEDNARKVVVANVGDCRAIVASAGWGNKIIPAQMSQDQNPDRPDERKRIESMGGVVGMVYMGDDDEQEQVISVEQASTVEEDLGPARVFFQPNVWEPPNHACFPGLAMSRSLGDTILDELGVLPIPEVSVRTLKPKDKFMVVASDGIWQVLSNEEVVKVVCDAGGDPKAASEELYNEAKVRWENEAGGPYRDDISVFVIYLQPK